MATFYSWPGSLPTYPVKSRFGESFNASILRTPMDRGPAKLRYRGMLPSLMTVSFDMTKQQVETLKTFVFETLRCTARFSFQHPVTQSALEVRIVPSNDGEMFKATPLGGPIYAVDMQFEVLP